MAPETTRTPDSGDQVIDCRWKTTAQAVGIQHSSFEVGQPAGPY